MAQTRIPFIVELEDGRTWKVTADLRDMRQWERNNKGQAFTTEPIPLERLNYVAWCASRRAGEYTDSFKLFDQSVVSLEPQEESPDEDDEVDELGQVEVDGELYEHDAVRPTQPTPGVGSSSSLP